MRVSVPNCFLTAALACAVSCSTENTLPVLASDGSIFSSDDGTLRVRVTPLTGIVRGSNEWAVQIEEGSPMLSLVAADAYMPAHGHGTNQERSINETSSGFVVSNLVLFMSGRWDVTLRFQNDGTSKADPHDLLFTAYAP